MLLLADHLKQVEKKIKTELLNRKILTAGSILPSLNLRDRYVYELECLAEHMLDEVMLGFYCPLRLRISILICPSQTNVKVQMGWVSRN